MLPIANGAASDTYKGVGAWGACFFFAGRNDMDWIPTNVASPVDENAFILTVGKQYLPETSTMSDEIAEGRWGSGISHWLPIPEEPTYK